MSSESILRHNDSAACAAREGHYLEGEQTYATLDELISSIVFKNSKHPRPWYLMLTIGFICVNVLMISLAWLLFKGVGVWGINIPVGWGFDIINFVWWIGIGHAGTLISAILLLLRQKWRNSINRFAEAMTLFAVMCAGLYPALPYRPSLGRVLLAGSHRSEHPGPLAAVPQPAYLGRFRGFDLPYGLRCSSGSSA